jgi:chromosome segregation ATPase
MVDWARTRRVTTRQLADACRRVAGPEEALAQAQATVSQAESRHAAASNRVSDAQRALDEARAGRTQARRGRHAARQAHERASVTVTLLRRQVSEITERLDRISGDQLPSQESRGGHGAVVASPPGPGAGNGL